MFNLDDIEREEVSSGEFTDLKNITHSVKNTVVKDNKKSLADAEDMIVKELYNIFSFRPRKGKA